MSFGTPEALWLLLALVLVLPVQIRSYVFGRRDLLRLLGFARESETQSLYLVKSFFGYLMFNAAVAFAVLALADPSWGERPVEEDRDGLDLVVSLDISRSMLATDISPSRLSRGLSVIRAVSRELPRARFALVVFKGEATILLPITEDLNSLEAVIDGIDPRLVSAPGTDLERGLDTALDAFAGGSNAHRAVLLVSDGETLTGAPERAARRAQAQGTPVIAVIAGTEDGAVVPSADGSPVVDEDGRPVVSRAVPAVLRSISEQTSSLSFQLGDVDIVGKLADEIQAHVRRRDESGFRLVAVRRYPLFIGASLVSFLLFLAARVFPWHDLF